MKTEHIYRHWEARIRGTLELLRREWKKCGALGDVESIHRLRVFLRRLRLYLQLGKSVLDSEKVDLYREWALEISAILGPIRDIDVAIGILKTMQGTDRLCTMLAARRQRMWDDIDFKRKPRRVSPLAGYLRSPPKHSQKNALRKRYEKVLTTAYKSVGKHHANVDEDAVERWHEIRRNIRRIRYLREMVLTPTQQKSDRRLKSYLLLQAHLGHAQNCAVTIELLPVQTPLADVDSLKHILTSDITDCYAKANSLWIAIKKMKIRQE